MKTFTSSISFRCLIGSLFTFSLLAFSGTVAAFQIEPGSTEPVNSGKIIPQVEYVSLVASATEKAVFISWVTAAEQNNSHFEVERSADRKSFQTVAMVLDGFSTNGTGKSYRFKEDAGALKSGKTMYYRLKQVDTNNEVHYSTIMAVHINSKLTVFPKPEAVQVNADSQVDLASTGTGQTKLSKQSDLKSGL